MTTTEAIKQLQTEHDLIAHERDLDGSQFAPALLEALAMAIEVLKCSEIPNCSEPKCADGCIYGWGSSECGHCDYRSEDVLKSLPPAQPEREKGKWIVCGDNHVCSECDEFALCDAYDVLETGEYQEKLSDFCPNCGADMRQSNAD